MYILTCGARASHREKPLSTTLSLRTNTRHNSDFRIAETKENAPDNGGSVVLFWLRGQDSNLRPLGYEPNELPLLHPAVMCV